MVDAEIPTSLVRGNTDIIKVARIVAMLKLLTINDRERLKRNIVKSFIVRTDTLPTTVQIVVNVAGS